MKIQRLLFALERSIRMSDIFTSDSFTKMAQTVLMWGIATVVVLIISYFLGLLSHPLVRAKKRISKFRVLCISLGNKLEDNNGKNTPELIKALRKIMKKKKSVATSLNVYIYDDIKSNLNVKYSTSCLDAIDTKCKNTLTSILEDDYKTAYSNMEIAANIALNLYKKLDEVIKKESNDKMLML